MTITDWIQAISMLVLVVVTGIYAWRTFTISNATKKQADASVKMAEEMRKDRQQTSRPVIVIVPMHEPAGVSADYLQSCFSYFEICNEGSGPAVNLEIRVRDKDKNCLDEKKVLFLRAHETMKFSPDIPLVNQAESTCYLLCGYWTVLSKGTEPPPYITGLLFKIRKSSRVQDKVIVSPIKLLFGDEAEAFLKKS
jgi:hypothetical protein